MLAAQVAFHLGGQPSLQLFRAPRAVEQIDAALLEVVRGVVLIHIGGGMNRYKIRGRDQIGRAYRVVAKPQVRLSQAARFH